MKIQTSIVLPNTIKLLIVEIDEETARENFDNRFQVAVEIDGERFFPKNKRNYLEFEESDYLYSKIPDKFGVEKVLPPELFCALKLCDKSLEDVNTEILSYMSMYNEGQDLKRELKKNFGV